MAEEKKSAAKSTSKPEKKKGSADAAPAPKAESDSSAPKAESDSSAPKAESDSSGRNGKGDGPRSIFSEEFRSNYDSIDWGR